MTDLQDGLPSPRRYFAVVAIALAITMSVLDGAIVNVALPQIARELHATAVGSIWIVNAYQLAIAVSLLPLAALGEIIGFRKVYQAGLVLFTLGSLGCALSHTLGALTAARVLQGLGAAGIFSMNGALVRFTYPARLFGRGIGINALVIAAAAGAGPSVAAAILAVARWEWLFAVNVPIGVVTLAIAAFALPATPGSKRRFDWVSAGLNALALGALVLGAEGFAHGQKPALAVGLIASALAAGALLVARELPRCRPMVPLDLMRNPVFTLSVLASIAGFTGQTLAYVALPFDFEAILHRNAVQTGLLMTPWPLATGIAAWLAGRQVERTSAAILGGAGMLVFALGLLSLAFLPPTAGDWDIAWRMTVAGAGFGCFQTPNNRTMIGAAPRERTGAAGGMLAMARLLGQTAGASGVALLFRFFPHGGTRVCLCVGVGFAGLGAVASLMRRTPPPVLPARTLPAEPLAPAAPREDAA